MDWDNLSESHTHQNKKTRSDFFFNCLTFEMEKKPKWNQKKKKDWKNEEKHELCEFEANQMISKQKLNRKSEKQDDKPTKRRSLVYKILVH